MAISLNNIVDVSVEISNPTTISSNFNLGLIIGNSGKIDASTRIKKYTFENYSTQMVTDGFAATDPEYKAATLYFSQSPTPSSVLIGGGGASETAVNRLKACREKNDEFFGVAFCYSLEKSDVTAIAAAVEAYSTPTYFFFNTNDATCLTTGSSNILKTLQDSKYDYTCGNYSTDDLMSCGLLGVFCGLNTMQANSAYTMAFKSITGVAPESITNAQFEALKSYNGNAYVAAGRSYSLYLQGTSASGKHTDEVYFLCAAKFLIQENTVAGLVNRRKVPQTESGLTDIINFIAQGCEALASIGMIASGIWNGDPVMDLNTGDAIAGGYSIQSETMASQSAADRAARVTPPIYVCLKGSGAIEHVVIRVLVNR